MAERGSRSTPLARSHVLENRRPRRLKSFSHNALEARGDAKILVGCQSASDAGDAHDDSCESCATIREYALILRLLVAENGFSTLLLAIAVCLDDVSRGSGRLLPRH